MAVEYSRADSLREWLTGAASDGGAQSDPAMSFGNYRSSTPAVCHGLVIDSAITNVTVDFASGGNPEGAGRLRASDANTLAWSPPGETAFGPPAVFVGPAEVGVVEANSTPGRYLRVTGSPPFSVGTSTITLTALISNAFGFPEVSEADALAGITQYRAVLIKNQGPGPVTLLKRWIGLLGTPADCGGARLAAAGNGTIITNQTLVDWPAVGYAQVRKNDGTLREIVYYSSRTNISINVVARALLGSSSTAGVASDTIYPVPGVAIAANDAGVQAGGSAMQTIANATTAPTGVTWNTGITSATGVSIATLAAGQQVGLWLKREVPAGAVASPLALVKIDGSFSAY